MDAAQEKKQKKKKLDDLKMTDNNKQRKLQAKPDQIKSKQAGDEDNKRRDQNDREGEDNREEGEEDDQTRTCQNCGAESASENHIRTCGKFMLNIIKDIRSNINIISN